MFRDNLSLWRILGDVIQDLRYGLRVLYKTRVFTITAILVLSLGLGANTAVFSAINAVMLRPLPVREPNHLFEFVVFSPSGERHRVSFPLYKFFTEHAHSYDGMLAESPPTRQSITILEQTDLVETQMVSGSYYQLLGINPVIGRTFVADDDRAPGVPRFAVISFGYWQRRFMHDQHVIGKTFKLNKTIFTIIGVTPKDFTGTTPGHDPDITFPLAMCAEVDNITKGLTDPNINWLSIIGRLKNGVALTQAQTEAATMFTNWNRLAAADALDAVDKNMILRQTVALYSAAAGLTVLRVQLQNALQLLMCIVGLLLLLACINLSSLLVGKTFSRLREISVRVAVGATRGRLIRQYLAEISLLALSGGVVGIILSAILCRSLVMLLVDNGQVALNIHPDWRVLAFTAILSLASIFMVGIAPAFHATRLNVSSGLARNPKRLPVTMLLVTGQISISLLLLSGASLFARTLISLRNVDAGFHPDGILVFRTASRDENINKTRLLELQTRMLDRLNTIPGVASATLATVVPLTGDRMSGRVDIKGLTQRENKLADFNKIGPKFFQTLETPLLMGREFDDHDTRSAPEVAIVNRAFAQHYFGNRSPLGQRVNGATIIAVVQNAKYDDLRQDFPETVYFAASQDTSPPPSTSYLVRVQHGDPLRLNAMLSQLVRGIDPALQVSNVTTMADIVDRSIVKERVLAMLSSFFGAAALILTCVGVFGAVVSHVSRRTNEFGIRLALGAQRVDVLKGLFAEVFAMLLSGIVLGAVSTAFAARVATPLLFKLKPTDATAFGISIISLVLATLIAAYIPARRAVTIDPVEALRAER